MHEDLPNLQNTREPLQSEVGPVTVHELVELGTIHDFRANTRKHFHGLIATTGYTQYMNIEQLDGQLRIVMKCDDIFDQSDGHEKWWGCIATWYFIIIV